jgi:hypothetical protein
MIGRLLRGERTIDVARVLGVSAARVSQRRRELHDDWLRFHGEDVQAAVGVSADR